MSLDWENIGKEASELLAAYVRVDTTNPPGKELAGARFLKAILEKEGFSPVILESQPERGNLVCRMKGTSPDPALILLHHIDVVPAEAEKWSHPPLSGTIIDGEIWGRGAQDCKSLGIMQLMAFILLRRQGIQPRRDIVYLAAADEEAGGRWGVEWLFQNHPGLIEGGFVINEGGGIGMKMGSKNIYTCQTAEKGVCWFKLTFRGKPGHGSIPPEDNCVVKMAKAIEKISSYRSPIRRTRTTEDFIRGMAEELPFFRSLMLSCLLKPRLSEFFRKRIPDAGLRKMAGAILRNTFVPTVTQAGNKTNVIPSECYCQVDCRILPGVTPEMVEREVRRMLAGIPDYQWEILQTSPASESPVDTPLYAALVRALKTLDPNSKMIPEMLAGATDSRFFRRQGITAYGFQPLAPTENLSEYLGRIHGHDERISQDCLVFGTRVLYQLLAEFCG